MAKCGQPCWADTIQEIKRRLFQDPEHKPDKEEIAGKLQAQYRSEWYNHLWSRNKKGRLSAKLKWYRKLSKDVKKEPYLEGPMTEIQRAMARFRVGGHGLPIEVGRWENIKYKQRLCSRCGLGVVGDELHVFNCDGNDRMRPKGFPTIASARQAI